MDINKWLADTAVAVEPARNPDQPGYPAETEHPKKTPVLDLPFSKGRAKRYKDISKDSSILASEDIPIEVPERRVARQAHQYSDDSVLSENAGYSSRREDEDDDGANPYQRRKRHKTKADRYDPKPRKPSTGQQEGGKQMRKSTKRDKEAKRSKKGKSAPSVVRNFHAANVPRERLTLQPRPNVGIFKKGKASSPFRGRGLPDLAFSEMNFLQKRGFLADDAANTDEPNKRRKRDKNRATEEEISSYFGPKRAPLAERSQNDRKPQQVAPRDKTREVDGPQRQPSTTPSIRPTVEDPALSELVDKKGGPRSTSNTYFTWSDSLRRSSRSGIVRPASATDIEVCRVRSASNPLTATKVRASSYDIRHPGLVEKRHPVRRQTIQDSKRKTEDENTGYGLARLTTTPSSSHSNHQIPDLERTTSGWLRLPPIAKDSGQSTDSQSLLPAVRSPAEGTQQHDPILLDSTRIPQAVVSTPVLESQDATSTSIAKLLNDCDTAYLRSTRTRTPRLQPTILDHRTRSRSTNDASIIRHSQRPSRHFRKNTESDVAEEVLDAEQVGPFSADYMEDPRMPEMRDDTNEPSEVEDLPCYRHPNILEYQERVPLRESGMPTRWPPYETRFNHIAEYGSIGRVPLSDLEDELSERLDIAEEEEEEEDGLAGFWRPNMLY